MNSGVAVENAIDIAQDHQEIRLQQRRDERGQMVVVAEFYFLDRHRVVLVHHRNDGQLEQRLQGVLGVKIAAPIGQILMGQQHLGHTLVESGEIPFIDGHQLDLPHRCQGLFLLHRFGSLFDSEPGHPRGHRPGADHDQLFTLIVERGEIPHQSFDPGFLDPFGRREDLAPDFDNHTARAP